MVSSSVTAQWNADFINYQKSFPAVNEAMGKRMDTLIQQFSGKGISWPAQEVYFRCFKIDKRLELWVKDGVKPGYQLFKTYKICGLSGKPGPKRKEGDRQIPEGFYYINNFNPNSNFHLSLGLNYPNMSDKILADAVKPGGDIYIHGDCVSVGCLAMTDVQIEDLYILGTIAKSNGQDFIPVHIFPGNFENPKSRILIQKLVNENESYAPYIKSLQSVFYHFEKEKELPAILINGKGEYVIQDVTIPAMVSKSTDVLAKKLFMHNQRNYENQVVENAVSQYPVFQGGNEAYSKFVKNISSELGNYLDEKQKKAYVYTEFIVNTDGTISNVEIKKGGNESVNDLLINRLENTKNWIPAVKDGKEVPYKMTQTFFIELIPEGMSTK
jgi:murein L,D-transpeptidase YafK